MTRARVSGAKLAAPALTDSIVHRIRLADRIDALARDDSDVDVMLISAPAGFGKTTLVAARVGEWVAAGRRVAWCSLDAVESSSFRFWSLVVAAIAAAEPDSAENLRAVPVPHRSGDYSFLAELSDVLTDRPVLLVLDNLQEVRSAGVIEDLDRFLAHLPSRVRVLLVSRADPPLSVLHGLRMSGRLVQLRAADLAFTEDEVALVCADLPAEQQRAIHARTEGWPALVRLMQLASQETGIPELEVGENGGALADYLFQETFRRQSDAVQHTLLTCSVPEAVPLDLAVLLSGQANAGGVLEDVARRSGLVARVSAGEHGPHWYRFHPILRAYLRGELIRGDRDAERRAHRTAAEWFLAVDMRLEAVRHAVWSDDDFRERVVRSTGAALVNSGESELLAAVLTAPAHVRRQGLPWTHLMAAAALLDQGRVPEAVGQLALAETDAPTDPDLVTARRAVEVHIRRRQGLPASQALLTEPVLTSDPDLRILLEIQRGSALLWRGDLTAAAHELTDAVALARGLDRHAALIDCLTFLATLGSAQSDFAAMAPLLAEVFPLAEEHGWGTSSRMAFPHVLEGWRNRQALDDRSARYHADRAVALLDPSADPTIVIAARALHGLVSFQMEDGTVADADRLHSAWDGFPDSEATPSLVVYAALADARASLSLHKRARAEEVLAFVRSRVGESGEHQIIAAMLEETSGHVKRAHDLVDEVARGEVEVVAPLSVLDAQVMAATLALKNGDAFEAVAGARLALEHAERFQALRPLVDAGEPLVGLFREQRGRWGVHEHLVERVLGHEVVPAVPELVLTGRELDVLRELPNLRTVDEIAQDLFVSANTVKTHLRSVYRKLDVTSRREAVDAARRAGLL